MAYYNGFPATYPGAYQTAYPAPQMPVYGQQMPNPGFQSGTFQNGNTQPMQQPQQQPTQMMTPPTIRAEIVQVEDEKAASNFPVGAGASQMMIARDESAIFIKSAMANGQTTLDVFEKRPPAPPAPAFDPEQYVRKDELEMLVSAALAAQQSEQATRTAPVAARRASKKEDE